MENDLRGRNEDTCKMENPCQEPRWDESGIESKVERLRNVVRNLERELENMTKYMNQLIGHSHVDGKIVKELPPPHCIEPAFYPYKSRELE